MIQFFTADDVDWSMPGPYTVINDKCYYGKWVKKAPDRFVVESLDSPGYYLHTNGKFYPKTPPFCLSDEVVSSIITGAVALKEYYGSQHSFNETFNEIYDTVVSRHNKCY